MAEADVSDDVAGAEEERVHVYHLRVRRLGKAFTHTLREWPVFTVDLRVIEFCVVGDEQSYHGLIRDDPCLLPLPRPFDITVSNTLDCCFVKREVDDFKETLKVDNMSLLPDGVMVVWKWEYCDDDDVESEGSKQDTAGEDGSDHDDERTTAEEHPSHTLTFKCIGSTRDSHYQEALHLISTKKPVQQVQVNLQPEPDNPVDSRAIAFVSTVDNMQYTIGYAVREVLDELHDAIKLKQILDVKFAWVKYLVQWTRTGPGYYCGINITKKGEWSQNATRYQSTR